MSGMRSIGKFVRSLLHDQQGMEAIEWAILAGLLVVAVIAVASSLGMNVLATFTILRNGTK